MTALIRTLPTRLAALFGHGSPWREEIRELLKLAGPLVATQIAQIVIITTDVVLLGRYSKEALAGSALGLTVYMFVFQFGFGLTVAVSPMVAQIVGARPGDRARVRAVVRMAFWLVALVSLPLVAGLFLFTGDILRACGQDPALSAAAARFVRPLSLGIPFVLAYQVLRNFATALGHPKAPLVVVIATIFYNAVVDYALIFGRFGMPELGLVGSGIAGGSAFLFSFLVMSAIVFATPKLRSYRLLHHFFRPAFDKFCELIRLGVPIGLTMLFEVMLFNAATLLVGTFGTAAVAAHQITVNISTITFMVPLGIGMAATVRVGMAVGAKNAPGVRRAGTTALAMSAAFMSLCALLIACFPHRLAALYFSAADPGNAGVLALAAIFLRIAAAYQIFDGIQVTSTLALRGLKDTRIPMFIAAACYWLIGFPTCVILSRHAGFGAPGVWIGLALALTVAAVTLSRRFMALTRQYDPGVPQKSGSFFAS